MIEPYYTQQSVHDIASATLQQRFFNYSNLYRITETENFLRKQYGDII